MKFSFRLFIVLTTAIATLASADLTVYCKNTAALESQESFGGLEEYKTCESCDCYVFELLCLEKKTDDELGFNLFSRSLDYAKSCQNCVCNSDKIEWAYQRSIQKGLSKTTMIPIAPYTTLAAAASELIVPNYAKDMIGYITEATGRESARVNDPMNAGTTDSPLPRFFEDLTKTPSSCSNNVSCDLLYDTDWSFRLRTELPCADAASKNPCFATNACLCNNGYFSVSEAMPEIDDLDVYTGDTEMLVEF